MAAKALDRIDIGDDKDFLQEYLLQRRPVIIKNLFEGEGIRQIASLQDARETFGVAKLKIQASYSDSSHEQLMTFNEYWDFVSGNPSTDLLCTEYEIPARVMTQFKLPAVCRAQDLEDEEILSMPRKYGDYDILANVFVANKGNKAHLHFDGDHRHVFLYQVFGRKEVILFETKSGIKLKPTPSQIFSDVYLESMTNEEKLSFIDAADGYYGMLNPGEAVYMPMLIWHYLGYVDDAMSFNIRFGRTKYGRFLSVDHFPRDYYIQNVGALINNSTAREAKYKECIDEVTAEYVRPTRSRDEKAISMRSLFAQWCTKLCPDAQVDKYLTPTQEREAIQGILRNVQRTMCYSDPKVLAAGRPVGSVSSSQKRNIEESARKCGLPPGVLEKLLFNRLGKPRVEQLTKVEANQFLSYLRSPGSTW